MSVKTTEQVFASDEGESAAARVCLVARGFLGKRVGRLVFGVESVNEFGEVLENPFTELLRVRVVFAQFTNLFVARTSKLLFEYCEFPGGVCVLGGELRSFFRRH